MVTYTTHTHRETHTTDRSMHTNTRRPCLDSYDTPTTPAQTHRRKCTKLSPLAVAQWHERLAAHTHTTGSSFLFQTTLNVRHILPPCYVHHENGHSDVPKQLLDSNTERTVGLQKHDYLVFTYGAVHKLHSPG